MANPFYTNGRNSFVAQPQVNMKQVKQVYDLLRNSGDPNQLINQMIQQNPQMAQTLNLIKSNGNYEQMFRDMCKQRGINADDFIKKLTE